MNHLSERLGWTGVIGFCLMLLIAGATCVAAQPKPHEKYDWRWVKGAVFVPTNAVNEAQQWDQYDTAINDRELHYASVYGINCVRVFLHYFVYLKDKQKLLNNIEDFLTRANKYHIKVEFVFFDDCWNQPPKEILNKNYQYPVPIYGVHNSRWLQCPGDDVKAHYEQQRPKLKAYVQDIVNAHKNDPRIAFWETYNEPNHSAGTVRILRDAEHWIHATGTTLPVTATDHQYAGGPYSDFISWHEYGSYKLLGGPDALCTECMNRDGQTVPGIVEHFAGHTGWEMWEFGIGRDNCRFAWDQNRKTPATKENKTPFHGIVYPDGHPWSVDDVKAIMGTDAFAHAPLFNVEYFRDDHFGQLAKQSVTPMIDFDLPHDRGLDSIDPQAGIPAHNFSVRWTARILAPTAGTYRFYIRGNGTTKLRIDGIQLTDQANSAGGAIHSVELVAGQHAFELKYVHGDGAASLHVDWSGPKLKRAPITACAK